MVLYYIVLEIEIGALNKVLQILQNQIKQWK